MSTQMASIAEFIESLRVIHGMFDSHTLVPLVPDHLLNGLTRNSLHFTLSGLETDQKQREFEIFLLCTLADIR